MRRTTPMHLFISLHSATFLPTSCCVLCLQRYTCDVSLLSPSLRLLLIMPLLLASLLLSGAGQVLCLGIDGQAEIKSASLSIECSPYRSGDTEHCDSDLRLECEAECVVFLIEGPQIVLPERPGGTIRRAYAQPLVWLTPRLVDVDDSLRFRRWLSQSRPSKSQEARSLRTTSLLI